MKKVDLLRCMSERKIIIFGTGERGNKFYWKYKDKLHMAYVTSNLDDKTIGNLERVEWRDFVGNENYLIVVCSQAENEIAYQLLEEGLVYGKDFIDQNLAEALLDEKEIVLFVGQCELEVIDYMLNSISEFTRQYVSICYREYDVLGIKGYRNPKLEMSLIVNSVSELADYFIYPANLSKERQDYYQRLLNKLPSGCKSVSVPLTTFEGYWPQDLDAYYEPSPYYKRDTADKFPFGGRRDNNLEAAVKEGKAEETLKDILRDDFYTEEEVCNLFRKSLKKYKVLERKSDIKICDFIEGNYMERKVFLDRGHVCDFVLKEYAKRIVIYLDISLDVKLIDKADLDWYNQCHSEQPIYPSVQKQLKFCGNEVYRFWFNGGMRYMGREEYFSLLCRYMESVKRGNSM